MIEAFEEIGSWWLPESEHTVSGTVRYTPEDGISLQLIGTLVPEQVLYETTSHHVVHGMSESLSVHTLTDCRPFTSLQTYRSWATERELVVARYHVQRIYKGRHLADPDGGLISEITVKLSNLESWLYDLDMMSATESGDEQTSERILRYRDRASRTFELADSTCEFWTGVAKSHSRRELGLRIGSGIDIETKRPRNLDTMMQDFVHPLRSFLDIAAGQPNVIKKIEIKYAEEPTNPDTVPPLHVSVLFHDTENARVIDDYTSDEPILRNELISSTEAFASEGQLIGQFFDLRGSINATIDLYLLSRHFGNSFPFLELSFVAAVNALEAYHNERRVATKYEDKPWKLARKALKDALPKAWRGDVLQAFDYIKVMKLRPALAELFGDADPLARLLGEDRKALINAIVNTRNYFSHYAKELEAGKLDVTEVFYCMQGLLAIIEVLLLRDLGFTRETAVERVRATQRSNILRAITIPPLEKDDQGESQVVKDAIEGQIASGAIVDVTTSSMSDDESSSRVEGDLPAEDLESGEFRQELHAGDQREDPG